MSASNITPTIQPDAFKDVDTIVPPKPISDQQQQPGLVKQVYDGVASLVNTASNALPTSAALPSALGGKGAAAAGRATHLKNEALAHRGGVGSLPGTPNEEDVVRLPEEREHPDPFAESEASTLDQVPSSSINDDRLPGFAGGAPTGAGETAHLQHTGGSIVGANADNHHGLGLPHERTDARDTTATNVQGTGLGFPRESTALGAGATTATTTHDTSRTHHDTGDRLGNALERSAPHHEQNDPASKTKTQVVADRTKGAVGIDTQHQAPQSAEERSPSSPTHKASLRDKLRGDAMIVSGKMTNDPAKVEEGKALKAGTIH